MIQPNNIVYDSEKAEYQVIDFLGSGSFGEVYSIEKKEENKLFALKTIPTPFVDDVVLKSFINEGKTALQIEHSNVIQYYYFHDGSVYKELPLYIIMEYADGGTLDKKIKERKDKKEFFTNEELILMFSQLIAGMKAVNLKLVHRDIKPDNILIQNNSLKISDFGLSKFVSQATRTSTFKGIGCLPYLAPEGWRFEKNTIQMDIYSMGLVFYELASLNFPYTVEKGNLEEWQNAHLRQIPENLDMINPHISPIISRVIMRMVEKEINKRFNNWDEIQIDLNKVELQINDSSEIIHKVLKSRNEREQIATQERLKRDKREKEIIDFKKLILFQYHKDIINPIKTFIDEINSVSNGSKILYNFDDASFINSIQYTHNKISIELYPIIDEDFYRDVSVQGFNRKITRRELRLPQIDKNRVLAWGLVKANDDRGFNLILIQKLEQIYGDFILLFNRHNVGIIKRDNRPEPFPFEMKEIEEDLNHLNAMHIYVTDRSELNLDIIKNFLSEYF